MPMDAYYSILNAYNTILDAYRERLKASQSFPDASNIPGDTFQLLFHALFPLLHAFKELWPFTIITMPKPSTVGKGGKAWTRREEYIFWKKLVPESKKRLGDDIENNKEREWGWVAREMQRRMKEYLKPGEPDRRNYTGLAMFEHYWQSARHRRPTPAAGRWPNRYINCEADPAQIFDRETRLDAVRKARRQARRAALRQSIENDDDSSDGNNDEGDDGVEMDEDEKIDFDEEEAIRKMDYTEIKRESSVSGSESSEDIRASPARRWANKKDRRSASPTGDKFNGTITARRRLREQRERDERDRNSSYYDLLGAQINMKR
ncbi:hypothetical protein B0T21DRAFT_409892 [Apiosordaria backusii]|uniref:Uncharacterized protein n=1 Tax=Apiosordaria backusii TaxID=314023 RepID=A0AA40BSD6_9PEZI|nr:hypothetical protein B0T21DRAFT_409892 [Apiosordaria backusii]